MKIHETLEKAKKRLHEGLRSGVSDETLFLLLWVFLLGGLGLSVWMKLSITADILQTILWLFFIFTCVVLYTRKERTSLFWLGCILLAFVVLGVSVLLRRML